MLSAPGYVKRLRNAEFIASYGLTITSVVSVIPMYVYFAFKVLRYVKPCFSALSVTSGRSQINPLRDMRMSSMRSQKILAK